MTQKNIDVADLIEGSSRDLQKANAILLLSIADSLRHIAASLQHKDMKLIPDGPGNYTISLLNEIPPKYASK
jgi:hypothetical protein